MSASISGSTARRSGSACAVIVVSGLGGRGFFPPPRRGRQGPGAGTVRHAGACTVARSCAGPGDAGGQSRGDVDTMRGVVGSGTSRGARWQGSTRDGAGVDGEDEDPLRQSTLDGDEEEPGDGIDEA